MKKRISKTAAFLLAIFMIVSLLPVREVKAAVQDDLWDRYMREALDDLFNHLGGKYFTVNQKPCNPSGSHASCDNCNAGAVRNTAWFKSCFSDRSYVTSYGTYWLPRHQYGTSLSRGGYTCYGFAGFGQYYIYDYLNRKLFSTGIGDIQEDGKAVASGSFNASFCKANVKVGDILRLQKSKGSTSGHSVIVYNVTDSGIEVVDNNWGSSTYGSNYTLKHTISYTYNSTYPYVYVSRPVNSRTKLMNELASGRYGADIPSNVRVSEQNGQVTITWDAVANTSVYALYMKDTSGNVSLIHNRISTNSFSFNTQQNGQKLGFVVKAFANSQWGNYSDTAWVTVSSSVRPPATVTATPGPGQATVSWEAVPGAKVYALFMKDTNGTVTLVHNRVTENSYVVNGLKAGASYGFVVKAYVGRQWSGYSSTAWMKSTAGSEKVSAYLDIASVGWTTYNVGLDYEMNANKVYTLRQGAKLDILDEKTNSRGNKIYRCYSYDLGMECYISAKYVKTTTEGVASGYTFDAARMLKYIDDNKDTNLGKCSAFVTYCLVAGYGIPSSRLQYGNFGLVSELLSHLEGARIGYTQLSASSSGNKLYCKDACVGDIVIWPGYHTAIITKNDNGDIYISQRNPQRDNHRCVYTDSTLGNVAPKVYHLSSWIPE